MTRLSAEALRCHAVDPSSGKGLFATVVDDCRHAGSQCVDQFQLQVEGPERVVSKLQDDRNACVGFFQQLLFFSVQCLSRSHLLLHGIEKNRIEIHFVSLSFIVYQQVWLVFLGGSRVFQLERSDSWHASDALEQDSRLGCPFLLFRPQDGCHAGIFFVICRRLFRGEGLFCVLGHWVLIDEVMMWGAPHGEAHTGTPFTVAKTGTSAGR